MTVLKQRQLMRPKNVLRCGMALCLFLLLGSMPCQAATKVLSVRSGVHDGHTRLIFDAEGDLPVAIGPATEEGISVQYRKFQGAQPLVKTLSGSTSGVTGVAFSAQAGVTRAFITFREKKSAVKHSILPAIPPAPGRYRLVMDIFPTRDSDADRAEKQPELNPENDTEQEPEMKVANEAIKMAALRPEEPAQTKPVKAAETRVEEKANDREEKRLEQKAEKPSERALRDRRGRKNAQESPQPSPEASRSDNGRKEAGAEPNGTRVSSARAKSQQEPVRSIQGFKLEIPGVPEPGAATVDAAVAEPLYAEAERTFLEHQDDLAPFAFQVLEAYTKALKGNPAHPNAPLALFRCGVASTATGGHSKAEKYYQALLFGWPGHPLSGPCWMRVGEIHTRRGSVIEAVEAFRAALRTPLEPADRVQASFGIGKNLHLAGVHKEALETLNGCLRDDPSFALKQPEILRFRGETLFALKDYDRSLADLFRYLNLRDDSPDRDLVLAKISEIFLQKGEEDFSNRFYNYIQSNYQDTEGDFISRIRKAELIEANSQGNHPSALAIYEDLAGKSLPPPLQRLVHFKLASWAWKQDRFEKSLHLIEEVLRSKSDTAHDEFIKLKNEVIEDWVKKAFAQKDYSRIIEIYEQYTTFTKSLAAPEIQSMIAESFAQLQLYPHALELYEGLLSKKRSDEWLLRGAQCSLALGNLDRSAQYCGQIQTAAFENPKGRILGQIAHVQGKHADAVKHFAKITGNGTDVSAIGIDCLTLYIKSLVELSRYADALPLLDKVLDRPDGVEAESRVQLLLIRSRCQQELKASEKAVEDLEAALALSSSDEQKSQVSYDVAKLYLALGQTEKASEKLAQLAANGSNSFWKAAAEQQLNSIRMSLLK